MQFFSGLMLDRIGIALQVGDVLVQAVVFLLKLLHLLLEDFCFFTLMGEGGETVMAKDDAVGHNEREGGGGDGGSTAAPQVDAVLGSPGELGQFDGELRFRRRGSQFRASRGS